MPVTRAAALARRCCAITWREIAKFLRQTERLLSALIRPPLWLLVFAAGLHDLLGRVDHSRPTRPTRPIRNISCPG